MIGKNGRGMKMPDTLGVEQKFETRRTSDLGAMIQLLMASESNFARKVAGALNTKSLFGMVTGVAGEE